MAVFFRPLIREANYKYLYRMNSTSIHNANKYTKFGVEHVEDVLTNEAPLQIHVNNKPFSVTMRTPGFEHDLARGILHSENVFTLRDKVLRTQSIDIDHDGTVTTVNAVIPENELDFGFDSNRSLTSVSSCGICGKEDISWRLFKWHATREFVRKSKKTAPSDYELLFAFQLLRDDEWVTPTGYSRRGFPISINAGGLL